MRDNHSFVDLVIGLFAVVDFEWKDSGVFVTRAAHWFVEFDRLTRIYDILDREMFDRPIVPGVRRFYIFFPFKVALFRIIHRLSEFTFLCEWFTVFLFTCF
jgi:hypothetical protein